MAHGPLKAEWTENGAELAAALLAAAGNVRRQWTDAMNGIEGDDAAAARALGGSVAEIVDEVAGVLGGEAASVASASTSEVGSATEVLGAYAALEQAILVQASRQLGRDLSEQEAGALCSALHVVMTQRAGAALDRRMEQLVSMSEGQAQIMSSLTHDLRGSLNGIVLMLEVLRRELVNKPQLAETLADVELMQNSIRDAVALMERHLYADRLRRSRIECRARPTGIAAVAGEVVGGFQERARAKGSSIAVRVSDNARVMVDPDLFRMAMQNLVDNAIKHAPAGRVEVVAHQQGDTWLIEIIDPGEGLSADQLARFLNPGANPGVKFKGLGLVIAHNAARLCGGRLETDGGDGRKGVFRLVLPSAQ